MAQKVKLANVLLSESEQFVQTPVLLCRSNHPFYETEEGWLLKGAGTFDFTTFFNALSVAKWQEYTVSKKFWLHLELKGAACTVKLTRADSFSYSSETIEGLSHEFAASESWQSLDIELPAAPHDVLEAFEIVSRGDVYLRNSYYYTEVAPEDIRPVELALCTTTFKKETYITRNIRLVEKYILDSDEPIAQHFQMHVVDNGRTLDASALSRGKVTVHPNDNVGGAGGFARGMIEAMEQTPQATHVLLMDDDVSLSPESVIRTYNLLTLVNDTYKDAFISGAMMSLNDPGLRWEDMGFINFGGAFMQLKPAARMDYFNDVVNNETFDIPSYLPKYDDTDYHYAAWWYCVIPMTQIKKNGLPLPIFVRGDDVEYSRRCKPRFMTMNGICIWHEAFGLRYNAAQERYQMTRNCLIDQFSTNVAPKTDFIDSMYRAFELDLKKFNYKDAALTLQGFEDFLKGPEWIMQPVAQEAFMAANRNREKLLPLDEIKPQAAKLGVDIDDLTRWKLDRDIARTQGEALTDYLSVGGNRFTEATIQKGKVAAIEAAGWVYLPGKLHGAEYIIAIDMANKKGIIRHGDRQKFLELWDRYRKDMRTYRENKTRLQRAYREARPHMTTVSFWKSYLGI